MTHAHTQTAHPRKVSEITKVTNDILTRRLSLSNPEGYAAFLSEIDSCRPLLIYETEKMLPVIKPCKRKLFCSLPLPCVKLFWSHCLNLTTGYLQIRFDWADKQTDTQMLIHRSHVSDASLQTAARVHLKPDSKLFIRSLPSVPTMGDRDGRSQRWMFLLVGFMVFKIKSIKRNILIETATTYQKALYYSALFLRGGTKYVFFLSERMY